jgi:hypothetical protein
MVMVMAKDIDMDMKLTLTQGMILKNITKKFRRIFKLIEFLIHRLNIEGPHLDNDSTSKEPTSNELISKDPTWNDRKDEVQI